MSQPPSLGRIVLVTLNQSPEDVLDTFDLGTGKFVPQNPQLRPEDGWATSAFWQDRWKCTHDDVCMLVREGLLDAAIEHVSQVRRFRCPDERLVFESKHLKKVARRNAVPPKQAQNPPVSVDRLVRAAIITDCKPDSDVISVHLFTRSGDVIYQLDLENIPKAPVENTPKCGCWHWPPFVPPKKD